MFLGIEIGGTKLQLALGQGDGVLLHQWRTTVDATAAAIGILRQIELGYAELLRQSSVDRSAINAVGIGFGGPLDHPRHRVVTSHQIAGWDDFPLWSWAESTLNLPSVVGNDADLAGLAEATLGAGQGCRRVFYITVGTGVGGGWIVDGEIDIGAGRGAAEIGHLVPAWPHANERYTVEDWSSGNGIAANFRRYLENQADVRQIRELAHDGQIDAKCIATAAEAGDPVAKAILNDLVLALGEAICSVIALLCPEVIVIGGGVSLMPKALFLEPLKEYVRVHAFAPYTDLWKILPAALGEEVVLHGAISLAKKHHEMS